MKIADPEPGYYQRRMVKDGPLVPVRIYYSAPDRCPETGALMSDERLCCEVAGEPADPFEQWSYVANRPITEKEYRYRLALIRHVDQYEPDAPEANRRTPINLSSMRPLF